MIRTMRKALRRPKADIAAAGSGVIRPITERVARMCTARPWRVLASWLIAMVASIVVISSFLGDALTTEAGVTTETESERGDALIAERLSGGPGASDVVVVRSETLTVDDAAFRAEAERLLESGASAGVLHPTEADAVSVDRLSVSSDQHAIALPLPMASDEIEPMLELVEAADGRDGFNVEITGELTATSRSCGQDLEKGELGFGLPAALVVLLPVFGIA